MNLCGKQKMENRKVNYYSLDIMNASLGTNTWRVKILLCYYTAFNIYALFIISEKKCIDIAVI